MFLLKEYFVKYVFLFAKLCSLGLICKNHRNLLFVHIHLTRQNGSNLNPAGIRITLCTRKKKRITLCKISNIFTLGDNQHYCSK
jgi:hypothetical protein